MDAPDAPDASDPGGPTGPSGPAGPAEPAGPAGPTDSAGPEGAAKPKSPANPKELVRYGYDQLAARYDEAFGSPTKYGPWLAALLDKLAVASRGHAGQPPGHARVLDLGCGGGVPVARVLAAAGHHVTGVDISETQVQRARAHVPSADFLRADATELDFPAASFDAVVTLYALIHMPLDEQPALLRRIADWLRPGGHLLATTGTTAHTGTDPNWLGSGTPMWWSHTDAATYRNWLSEAGLTVDQEEFVPEGNHGHTLFTAHRPAHMRRT